METKVINASIQATNADAILASLFEGVAPTPKGKFNL